VAVAMVEMLKWGSVDGRKEGTDLWDKFSRMASSSTFEMSRFASKFTQKNIQALSLKSAMLRGFY
jgi:hypothetical protein